MSRCPLIWNAHVFKVAQGILQLVGCVPADFVDRNRTGVMLALGGGSHYPGGGVSGINGGGSIIPGGGSPLTGNRRA